MDPLYRPPLAAALAAALAAPCPCPCCAALPSELAPNSSSVWLLLRACRFSRASISFCLLYICTAQQLMGLSSTFIVWLPSIGEGH